MFEGALSLRGVPTEAHSRGILQSGEARLLRAYESQFLAQRLLEHHGVKTRFLWWVIACSSIPTPAAVEVPFLPTPNGGSGSAAAYQLSVRVTNIVNPAVLSNSVKIVAQHMLISLSLPPPPPPTNTTLLNPPSGINPRILKALSRLPVCVLFM